MKAMGFVKNGLKHLACLDLSNEEEILLILEMGRGKIVEGIMIEEVNLC